MLEALQNPCQLSRWLHKQCMGWVSNLVVKHKQLFKFYHAHIYLALRQCKIEGAENTS